MEDETIRRIAYRNYQDRIRQGFDGDEKEDWFLAELEYEKMIYDKEKNKIT